MDETETHKPLCNDCQSPDVVIVDLDYDEYYCQRCMDKYGPEDWGTPRRL